MENLTLSEAKAEQLGRIMARMIGTQNLIMCSIKDGFFDANMFESAIRRHKAALKHLKRFFEKFDRVEVPSDQYYEGRLNAYRMALEV